MGRLLIIPLVLLVLVGAAVLWSGGGRLASADFTFVNRGEIGTLDPKNMSWLQDIRLGYALWEGLYALDPQTLDPIPGAAERVEISPDKRVYTFHMRPAGRWTDGSPVTAGDFLFAWKRSLEEPGDYIQLFFYIQGAQEYSEKFSAGARPDFANVGIHVLDPGRLRVTLKNPTAFFPDICAFAPFFPVHEPSMRRFAQPADPATGRVTYQQDFTRPPHLVGNGPYRLASWEFKRSIRLEASEHYWDRANVRSRVIEMVSANDPQWAFLKYDTGAVDWLAEVTGEIAAELRVKGRSDLRVFPGFGTYFYSINCLPKLPDGRDNPLADVRVRRALTMAIDKAPLVQNITRLGESTAVHYIPPDIFPRYRSPAGLGYDAEGARKLLAEAGYPGGKGFPRISLLYNTEGQHAHIAQAVRRQWSAVLGIDMDLEGVEIKVFRTRLHGKKYAVARASWIGDYNDPSTFTDKYLSFSDNNDSAWKSQAYDDLCDRAAREPDERARLELLASAEKLLLDEAPIIPVYHYVNCYLFRDNVSGVALHPRNMVQFKALHARR